MSFRTRLTGFFVLIVVMPMVAVGFLVFRLIEDSEQGKADARANGLAQSAASIYDYASRTAQLDAQTVARDPALASTIASPSGVLLTARVSALASRAGLARVIVTSHSRTLVDVGDSDAVAPGAATVVATRTRPAFTVKVSTLTASGFVGELASATVGAVVRSGGRTLGSTLPAARGRSLPVGGTITLGRVKYRAVTLRLKGFYRRRIEATILSDVSATESSVQTSEIVAAIFIGGFLLLALAFSALASSALQRQLNRFLGAARRLGSGDFSSPVPVEGADDFAALGVEFNNMSSQLKHRIDELDEERARLRESVRRIGQTFASNLDRQALLEVALRTAIDGVDADFGRLTVRSDPDDPLAETERVGSFAGLEDVIQDAERGAFGRGGLGEAQAHETHVAAVALLGRERGERVHGLITVGRDGPPFSDDEREVLRSLASQASLALDNVELHHHVRHQAATDELTGLANHGRFQELLSAEIEQVRRYNYPVGLIMLDVDDFKAVNDTYGHQQGDIVLKQVARVVRESSRDVDSPARYGGEEMAVILPHTDLEGAYAIAERVRTSVEALRIRRLDHGGTLRVSASLGVAAASDADKHALVAAADAALYAAKREGKNRTVRAPAHVANGFSAE